MTLSRKASRVALQESKYTGMAASTMRAYHLVLRTMGRTTAPTPEAFYGFSDSDVVEIYNRKVGCGAGVWYRLKDGRVIDAFGKLSDRNPRRYTLKPLPKPSTNGRGLQGAPHSQRPVLTNYGILAPSSHPLARSSPTISQLPRHAIPDRVMRNIAHETMKAHFRILQSKGKNRGTATPDKFYGFRAGDVDEMHFHKQGFGRGVWYRLKDGRVIDALGKPSETGRHWYASRAN